jgi:hypothetical protein
MKEFPAAIVVVAGACLLALGSYTSRVNSAAELMGMALCASGVFLLATFGIKSRN